MKRYFWVLVHRYVGLTMALFLIVVGLTGSILAFYDEIDDWLNPQSSRAHTRVLIPVGQPLLDPFDLCSRALKLIPHTRINFMYLQPQSGEAYPVFLVPSIDPATGQPYTLGFDVIKFNPYTGVEIERTPVAPMQEVYFPLTHKNILRFVYALHYQLALGETGGLLLGIIALIWVVDCFVGFYLTLPLGRKRSPSSFSLREKVGIRGGKIMSLFSSRQPSPMGEVAIVVKRSFWSRWKPAWLVKWAASFLRVNFDLHRAGGLWAWPMLFVFALSSLMLNLPQVYNPVIEFLFEYPHEESSLPNLSKPQLDPPIEFRTAYAIGQGLMAEQARLKGFTVKHKQPHSVIFYDGTKRAFTYIVSSSRDINNRRGETALTFDANTGKLLGLWPPLPSGEYSGITVGSWLMALHFAWIWGLPYKLFVCIIGLVVAMLSVTGVYIYFKKCRVAQLKRKVVASKSIDS